MELIPSDIVVDILSRLPVESVLHCKVVCKRLLNLLSHRWDQFAKVHYRRQLEQLASSGDASSSSAGLLFSFQKTDMLGGVRLYYGDKYNNEMNIHDNFSFMTLQETGFSYPRMMGVDGIGGDIVGSCNGLICLVKYGIHDVIHICNPITGEYVNLPEHTLCKERHVSARGFGYVHSVTNGQYKVVRIIYRGSNFYEKGEVQVYTIGSGSGWRTIGTTSYKFINNDSRGISISGLLHWIDGDKIVAFNLADEEFQLIQSPPCHVSFKNCTYTLQSLRGNLSFCNQRNQERLLDIWSLKKTTKEASWSRDFSIAFHWDDDYYQFRLRPLFITNKNEVIFVHQYLTFHCYDPETNTVIKLWEDDAKSELMRLTAVPHMNSFVSLKALGEKCESSKKARETSLEDTEY